MNTVQIFILLYPSTIYRRNIYTHSVVWHIFDEQGPCMQMARQYYPSAPVYISVTLYPWKVYPLSTRQELLRLRMDEGACRHGEQLWKYWMCCSGEPTKDCPPDLRLEGKPILHSVKSAYIKRFTARQSWADYLEWPTQLQGQKKNWAERVRKQDTESIIWS